MELIRIAPDIRPFLLSGRYPARYSVAGTEYKERRSGGQKYFVKPDLSEISFNPITTVHLNYEFLNPTFEGFLAIFMVFERS